MAADFELFGVDELKADCERLYKEYPSEAVNAVNQCATAWKKDVNNKYNEKSFKKWETEQVGGMFSGMTVEIDVTNKAPHFHLVENGHELYFSREMYAALKSGKLSFKNQNRKSSKKGGKNGLVHMGFVKGKHYAADVRDKWQAGKYEQELATRVDKMLKKHDL